RTARDRVTHRPRVVGLPVELLVARRPDLPQYRPRHLDLAEELRIPVERLEVHQHRARGIAVVGDVRPTLGPAGQPPDDPGIDVAEEQVAALGRSTGARDVVEDPLDLRPREVGGHDQSGLGLDGRLDAVVDQLLTDVDGAGVLPDDGVVNRLAGLLLPDHGGLALVGDADARELVGLDAFLLHRALDHALRLLPDLHRVVLDPTGLGINLLVFEVVGRDDLAIVAEHHEARSGGALVDGCRVLLFRHSHPPYVVVVDARWGKRARPSRSARCLR